ncbi:ABC transporter substrate-binding protein [Acuticoccus mangrovi]|uniref:ABC transporter substrate-binding protein n=1 Tax=Acuticoccus mangrovi TaxID=2796142 RepID=A0A934ING1_9HYPH|nr:ABC transporter substrate-binding protein [Acuticoccus mangrovi]MBJ3778141.1 ABC transporter substrate-binding protein [Acuticoccus mangrovi]
MRLKSALAKTAFVLGLIGAQCVSALPAAAAQDTIRLVLTAQLTILDPILTSAISTRTYAYLVYDTLIAIDADGNFKPQMLEGWDVSDDGLTYTFTLRDGLSFSDGAPVVAEDAVASIKRWWEVDSFGKRLKAATASLESTGDSTFTLTLSRPFGHVIQALGKPSSVVPVIMPARIASATPSNKAVTEYIGSGPFVFDSENWTPGSKATFHKNDLYKPRSEPASGLAGGKDVKIETVEIVGIPDSSTQVAALQRGEVDYLQSVPQDFVPLMEADPNITVQNYTGTDQYIAGAVINHAIPPFDNPKVRRALQAIAIPAQFMAGLGLGEDQWTACKSVFMCGSPLGNDAGVADLPEGSVETAKKLLAESGYNGEPVTLLVASAVHDHNRLGLVLEGLMKEAGFNVTVTGGDWPTVAKMRWSKETTENGGWNIMPITWSGHDLASPFTNYAIVNNCTDAYPGWSCKPEITDLIAQFEEATAPDDQMALARKIQELTFEDVKFLILGQYSRSSAYRSDLKDFVNVVMPAMWSVHR